MRHIGVPSFTELESHRVGAAEKVGGDVVHVEDGRPVPHSPWADACEPIDVDAVASH